jgi:uncharacterized protein (TIGR00369 family)
MKSIFNAIKDAILSQPFTRLIGAKLTRIGEDGVELTLPITEDMKQQHGFVHGGVISYLADNCLTCAGATVLGDCVTAEYKINYVRPGLGVKLVSEAKVISSGKRQAVCECKIYAFEDDKGVLIAVAQGTINKLSKALTISCSERRKLFQASF